MSREVRRVPLDFDHPLRQTWPGYLRQGRVFPACPDCQWGSAETLFGRLFPRFRPSESTGKTREAYAIGATFYSHQIGGELANALCWHDKLGQAEVDMLVAERRIGWRELFDRVDLSEPYELNEGGHPIRYRWIRNGTPGPTAAEVNAANRSGGMLHPYNHDAINRSLLVEHRCELLGIPVECPSCKGRCVQATDEEYAVEEAAAEAWEETPPPAGPAYQLWETVSEGSPVSPPCATPEELADWIIRSGSDLDGSTVPLDKLIAWIAAEGSSVGSFVVGPGGLMSGVAMAADYKATIGANS